MRPFPPSSSRVCAEQKPTRAHIHAAYENIEITTHSRPDAFPSALRQKLRKTQTKVHEGDDGLLKVTPVRPTDRLTLCSRAPDAGLGEVPGVRARGGVLEGAAGAPRFSWHRPRLH